MPKQSAPALMRCPWRCRRRGERLFPPYLSSVLHPFVGSLLHLDAPRRAAAVNAAFPDLCAGERSGLPPSLRPACRPEERGRTAASGPADCLHGRQSGRVICGVWVGWKGLWLRLGMCRWSGILDCAFVASLPALLHS